MTSRFIYTIEIPVSTSEEIVDWFASMDITKQLSNEIIKLVEDNLISGCITKSLIKKENCKEFKSNNSDKQHDLQETLINNLYNWQESKSAIFIETNAIKKEKKKMLSI